MAGTSISYGHTTTTAGFKYGDVTLTGDVPGKWDKFMRWTRVAWNGLLTRRTSPQLTARNFFSCGLQISLLDGSLT